MEAFSTSHTCQMWRNFRFLHIFHTAKFEITQYMEKFQISPHSSRIEIWNFSTWQIFLHTSHYWYWWWLSEKGSGRERGDARVWYCLRESSFYVLYFMFYIFILSIFCGTKKRLRKRAGEMSGCDIVYERAVFLFICIF